MTPPVSACHGAGDDSISPTCYPSRFFQWWNTVFLHPATELTNGALRRMNSGCFGHCNSHHFPDQTNLVIIELIRRMNRAFLFVFRLFLSFHPFFFGSIRYRFVATALRPPYFKPSYRHPNDGLSHTKQVQLAFILYHGFTPFHIFHQAMAITIFLTHFSLGEFRATHSILHHFPFPRNTPRPEGRA